MSSVFFKLWSVCNNPGVALTCTHKSSKLLQIIINEQIFAFMQQMDERMNELAAVNSLRFKFHVQSLKFASLN